MKASLLAAVSVITLTTPVHAHAQNVLGAVIDALGQEQARQGPARPVAPQNADRFGYPDYDPTARRVGDRLCFAFIPTGASRTADICLPTKNFADTLSPRPDLSRQTFAGNTVDTDIEQLAKCRIRRRTDPGLGTAPTTDPSVGYQLEVRCPSRREGGGWYSLNVAFNRDYYLPYRLTDHICGPDRSISGSEFDRYVRTTLGEPTGTNTRGEAVTRYSWTTSDTGVTLSPDAPSGNNACTNPMSGQINWEARIWISDAKWKAFDDYLGGLVQRQRDGGFTRF